MNPELKKYIPLLEFLSHVLGPRSEIVLQDIGSGLTSSVVYIKNNLSGREIGAPATDFLIKILREKGYEQQDFITNYQTMTASGLTLESSSFFIKDELGELIGMICINRDNAQLQTLEQLLTEGLAMIQREKVDKRPPQEITENFYLNADYVVEDTIQQLTNGRNLQNEPLLKREKIKIVEVLHDRGFFELKDAIVKVAQAFQMSEVSIYKYIQEIKKTH